MAFLYIDAEGNERNRHSYSAGLEFDSCPYKYWLHRIMGWKEKDTKAALLFGRCVEDAVQFYHATNGRVGEEEFVRLWLMQKDKPLVYTVKEGDWDRLMRAGREMLRLYAIRLPGLPIPMNTIFQKQLTREVFPNDPKYGGIEFFAKLDAIVHVDPFHPMLPPLNWTPKEGVLRKVIIDFKTSGIDFDDAAGIVEQDFQLRQYAWMDNEPVLGGTDVAFLWFKKSGHKIQKGTSVTLLATHERFNAGDEAVIASVEKDGTAYVVGNDIMLEEMNKAQGFREGTHDLDTTKAAKQLAAEWREANAVKVPVADITKQRLQFIAGRVSKASADDAGDIARDQIVRIVNAWDTNRWTNTFGVRFPHDDRRDPYFKAFVLKDRMFRDATFMQKVEEDLSDFIEEQEQESQ